MTAASLASVIAGHAGIGICTNGDDTNIVTMTADTPGAAGNDITMATNVVIGLTLSGTHLTGGQG